MNVLFNGVTGADQDVRHRAAAPGRGLRDVLQEVVAALPPPPPPRTLEVGTAVHALLRLGALHTQAWGGAGALASLTGVPVVERPGLPWHAWRLLEDGVVVAQGTLAAPRGGGPAV